MMLSKLLLNALGLVTVALPVAAYDLPKTVAEAEVMERADALPSTSFYSAPTNLETTKPGDLLRRESFSGYTLPEGIRTVRILYHSQDAHRRDLVTSAVVLIPGGTAPVGGWPIIAWAHGTSGVAQQCAPSLMKDLYYGDEGLSAMVKGGFAVVATDYQGLGTQGPHQYVSKTAQAFDVIYSVPAARAAVPELGRRWVADGHSQGGLAAWGVAELESGMTDVDYLGAISVAGAVKLDDFIQFINDTQGGSHYLAYLASGIQALFPAFKPEDMLSQDAMRLYSKSITQGCWFYGYAAFKDMPKGTTLRGDWKKNPSLQRFVRENEEGAVHVNKPLLVLAGEADLTIPIEGVRQIVRRACLKGGDVAFKSYPGLDHDPTMVESTPYQLAWIRDRLAGKESPSTCPARANPR